MDSSTSQLKYVLCGKKVGKIMTGYLLPSIIKGNCYTKGIIKIPLEWKLILYYRIRLCYNIFECTYYYLTIVYPSKTVHSVHDSYPISSFSP